MAWNANGLSKQKVELEAVLESEKIDVCLISETHFTKESFIAFKNFLCYHTIHPSNNARGGSAVIIRKNIQHNELEHICTEKFQITNVSIKIQQQYITFAAIYSPPKHSITADEYKTLLERYNTKSIIGGDFNAKHTSWGSRLTTTKGRALYIALNDINWNSISTGKPTYWPTDSAKVPDLIDFFIVHKISPNYISVEEGLELNSDHSPIFMYLSGNIILKEDMPYLSNHTTDWESFRSRLRKYISDAPKIHKKEDLELECMKFTEAIQKAAWESTVQKKKKQTGMNFPPELRTLISEKRRLRRKWQMTRSPADKRNLNNASQNLKRILLEFKNEAIDKYVGDLNADRSSGYSLWKCTKKLKRPTLHIPPLKKENGQWARTSQDKVDAFAEALMNTFSVDKSTGPNEDPLRLSSCRSDAIKPVSIAEVVHLLNYQLKVRKSPGFDLITAEVLKQLPHIAIARLTYLINSSFALKYVPSYWKVAEVIMINKPGKPAHEISSYRPISLLPILSKILERLLLQRLKLIIERLKLIPSHQFGFREKHSTIDQIHRITDVIEKSLEDKKVCSAVFLDVAQAFDKVWHEGLIKKLRRLIPNQFCDILESYLEGRHFRVRLENFYSELKPIKAGVPQGSILGPVLFLLYTSDVPTPLNSVIATFADDTAVLTVADNAVESTKLLQRAVNEVVRWTINNKISLNTTKSVHVDFTNKQKTYHPIEISGKQVPYSNTAKYLGMTLDAKLQWKEHIKIKKEHLELKLRNLNWLMGRKTHLSIHCKLLLYNQILKPVWMYGAQIWGCAKKTNIDVIQRFQNKVLRNIVDAPWYIRNADLHRDLNVPRVETQIIKQAEEHYDRIRQHSNDEANRLQHSGSQPRRLKRTKPFDLATKIN